LVLYGFMAAASEFVGGILLILGLLFKPACSFMAITMIIASIMHLSKGDGLQVASHAIELAIVFIGLIFIGTGEFTALKILKKIKNR